MKTILFVIVILSLFAIANGPACPGGNCPTPEKTKPVVTKPPPTEPPVITEPPATEPPHVIPTERGIPHPEAQITQKPEAEPRERKLPQSGYGHQHDFYYWLRWFMLLLIALAGCFLAGRALR